MRIVQGKFGGRHLTSPGRSVRPTAEPVRVRMMDLLESDLAGSRVLDLFAGSGALGLEALSRGARSADFVENGAPALHSLKANVAALRVQKSARIFKRDAIPFAEALEAGAYDVAFVDPPYGSRKLDRILARWSEVPFAEVLAVEHRRDHPGLSANLPRGKRYDLEGETRLTILRTKANLRKLRAR